LLLIIPFIAINHAIKLLYPQTVGYTHFFSIFHNQSNNMSQGAAECC